MKMRTLPAAPFRCWLVLVAAGALGWLAPPAVAQTWQTTLTVSSWGSGSLIARGCGTTPSPKKGDHPRFTPCSEALTDDDFTVNGKTYSIFWIEIDPAVPGLLVVFNETFEAEMWRAHMTFNGQRLDFLGNLIDKFYVDSGHYVRFWNHSQSWAHGQQVAITLTVPPVPDSGGGGDGGDGGGGGGGGGSPGGGGGGGGSPGGGGGSPPDDGEGDGDDGGGSSGDGDGGGGSSGDGGGGGGGGPSGDDEEEEEEPDDGMLQSGRFGVTFGAMVNSVAAAVGDGGGAESSGGVHRHDGLLAGWRSDKGNLYWLFEKENPEALFKVLDGRPVNGHWWLDLAVVSDLRTETVAFPAGGAASESWTIVTGPASAVWPGQSSSALAHCAYPTARSGEGCSVAGYGTTISLRDAWDAESRIPGKYRSAASGEAASSGAAWPPRWLGRELVPAPAGRSAAEVREPRGRLTAALGALSLASRAASPASAVVSGSHGGGRGGAVALQEGRFDVVFGAEANGERVGGRRAAWDSEQGALFWLFDEQNAEGLFKVLDGRAINGHWWLDLAVVSDLRTETVASPAGGAASESWTIVTGPASAVWPGQSSSALAHCAYPTGRSGEGCPVAGYGTTVSLRDAWDAAGRIPARYRAAASGGAASAGETANPPWNGRELVPRTESQP